MEDDDDAFLYGDDPAPGTLSKSATDADANKTSQQEGNAQVNGSGDALVARGDEETGDADEDEDDDEEEEDSDSDIEFIIDASQEGQQTAARPGYQKPGAPLQPTQGTPQRTQSTITSEYTPLSRTQLLSSTNPALSQTASTVAGTSLKPDAPLQQATREGGPPAVPSTAPRLNLSPGPEDRVFPKPEDQVEEDEVQGQDIFDIDIDALTEKPWRRYGADLTDYFNYGFNEESWNVWRGKKERMVDARKQAESQMFGNPMMPGNMQQMMAMMPPPQQMQAMMAQGAGMGMMPPEQMMAMMAGMSGMPPMGGPPMPPAMAAMLGGQRPNGMGGFNEDHQLTPMHQQRGQSEAPSEHGRDSTPRPGNYSHNTRQDVKDEDNDSLSQATDKPLAPPPVNLPMKPMSQSDMSAFFGASGVDMSQIAAAGLNTSPQLASSNAAAAAAPSGERQASRSPAPPAEASQGASIRGRAAASKGRETSPSVPSGPKIPGKRYNDRDTGSGGGDALDYGAHERDHRNRDYYDDRAHDEGRDRSDRRGRGWDDDTDSRDRTREWTSREGSGWDSGSHRDDRYARHRNDERTPRPRKGSHYDSQDRGGGWDDGEPSGRRAVSSRSKRGDDYDDETASQSSVGGRHRRSTAYTSRDSRDERSHRSERPRDYRDRAEPSSSRDAERDRDRDRERERDRDREARNQLRAERRAGKDTEDHPPSSSSTGLSIKGSRKRAAPEEHDDGPSSEPKDSSARRTSASRKKR